MSAVFFSIKMLSETGRNSDSNSTNASSLLCVHVDTCHMSVCLASEMENTLRVKSTTACKENSRFSVTDNAYSGCQKWQMFIYGSSLMVPNKPRQRTHRNMIQISKTRWERHRNKIFCQNVAQQQILYIFYEAGSSSRKYFLHDGAVGALYTSSHKAHCSVHLVHAYIEFKRTNTSLVMP